MKQLYIAILLIGAVVSLQAQTLVYNKYWVQFTDKDQVPFSVDEPEEFLSERALQRRERYNIDIDETDLPVDQNYIDSILYIGARYHGVSKWFNAIVVTGIDSAKAEQIRGLGFVADVFPVAALNIESEDENLEQPAVVLSSDTDNEHGYSFDQISMVNGDYLHSLGFKGEGMMIAVLDAGFQNVNVMPAFDSLILSGRLLGTYDMVRGQEDVFDIGTHGRNVLSIMAANMPGIYLGSAPNASYFLFRTEDGSTEFRIEESNWIMAMEKADSMGVDLINSSLGYSSFNDPAMNYTYQDMDGNTALISRGGDMAAAKGIMIVTSAGNEGRGTWHYVTAPADAENVLTIGAVDEHEAHASFSSYGPTADGRVKPDVCGQGQNTAYVGNNNDVYIGNGTSYSSPLIAGLVACLWQTDKSISNMDLLDIMRSTASTYTDPTDSLGFGLADFSKAHASILEKGGAPYQQMEAPVAYPNPFTDKFSVLVYAATEGNYEVEVYDPYGRGIYSEDRYISSTRYTNFDLPMMDSLPAGMYIIRVRYESRTFLLKAIKL